jgi:hypothetical protein
VVDYRVCIPWISDDAENRGSDTAINFNDVFGVSTSCQSEIANPQIHSILKSPFSSSYHSPRRRTRYMDTNSLPHLTWREIHVITGSGLPKFLCLAYKFHGYPAEKHFPPKSDHFCKRFTEWHLVSHSRARWNSRDFVESTPQRLPVPVFDLSDLRRIGEHED